MPDHSQLGISTDATRRGFLQTVMLAGAGGVLSTAAPQAARALEPIARNGKSHLKLSLAAYSYRQWLGGEKPSMTMDDFFTRCAEFNLDGCEPTSYWFPKEVTGEYLQHLKQLAFRLGLDISGTAIANDFCLPPGAERDAQLAHTRKWIDHAAALGAPVIRVFAGKVAAGSNEAEAVERCAAGMKEVLEYAAAKGVFLALENHGGITATSDQLLAIVERIDSPWFGINFDSGNFHTADPYADLARIAPYALNVQIKTDMDVAGKKGPADLERIIGILRAANYRGYVVLEYEGSEPAETAIPRYLAELRMLCRGT